MDHTDHTAAIRTFVVEEFLPDVRHEDLDLGYDLIANGVIDSLGLLKLIAWLEDTFDVPVDDVELNPDSFRTVIAINAFVSAALETTAVRLS
ncbi:phosphopantetheine-binding protein [Amycolatopsis minnesotensis]|uniref:Acyl carrier protein n=1 Tax=Amycolatopsis minnesotensis TaxID=337894 RepID=A0ABP5CJK3_9PSEU